MEFTIKAINFGSDPLKFREAPRDIVINSDQVLHIAAVDQSFRLSRIAPMTACMAIVLDIGDGKDTLLYSQSRLLNNQGYLLSKYDQSPIAQLLRACQANISDQPLTPETLRNLGVRAVRDASSLHFQKLVPIKKSTGPK